jgi:hypothetical protein
VTELQVALERELGHDGISVRIWIPSNEPNPDVTFQEKLTKDTLMVVTDYDLTRNGSTGFFGSTIVDWCKRSFIPVGDYSRGNALRKLPKEPDQYEIRVPSAPVEAARYIKAVAEGFSSLQDLIAGHWQELSDKRSPAAILASVLSHPMEETRFALYGTKIASANAALMSEIANTAPGIEIAAEMRRFLPYVLGHLLLNVVLRFPGPILNGRALASLTAVHPHEAEKIQALFEDARYTGPFGEVEAYYWTSGVDRSLNVMREQLGVELEGETIGQLNRRTLEATHGLQFEKHDCPRCHGEQGGLFCPFTKRTVCVRSDCSVVSNAWIPQGARLCRIEMNFYEEWAPLLGF